MIKVPIYATSVSQDELKQAIMEYSKEDISLTLIDNPEKFRSALSDPTVLAAAIGAGAAVVAALIGAFALIYTSRKEKDATVVGGPVIINVNVNINTISGKLDEPQIIIPLDNLNLEEYKSKFAELDLHPEVIENINYLEGL